MKKIFILTFLLLALSVGIINGQDLSQLITSDPVKISGSVGTQNTFFMSSNNLGYRSPFSNNLFMNQIGRAHV